MLRAAERSADGGRRPEHCWRSNFKSSGNIRNVLKDHGRGEGSRLDATGAAVTSTGAPDIYAHVFRADANSTQMILKCLFLKNRTGHLKPRPLRESATLMKCRDQVFVSVPALVAVPLALRSKRCPRRDFLWLNTGPAPTPLLENTQRSFSKEIIPGVNPNVPTSPQLSLHFINRISRIHSFK